MTKSRKGTNGGLVYSTDFGTMCPGCRKTKDKCSCKNTAPHPSCDGIVRLKRETKGRKGKGVTLITGVPGDQQSLKQLAKSLKQKCGSGGSVKNGIIEIQGDQRDLLEKELKALGYTVKQAGG